MLLPRKQPQHALGVPRVFGLAEYQKTVGIGNRDHRVSSNDEMLWKSVEYCKCLRPGYGLRGGIRVLRTKARFVYVSRLNVENCDQPFQKLPTPGRGAGENDRIRELHAVILEPCLQKRHQIHCRDRLASRKAPTLRVPFVDTRSQYLEQSAELDAIVQDVLSSGAYILGKHNRGLEEEIALRHGVRHAIAVNSGTDALRLMMQAAGIGPGDEIITTAFTFVSSVETIQQIGATPVLVDIDLDTFNINTARIEAAITPKTRGIMPIHLFGQLCDVEAIQEIAGRRELLVFEDAAQAIVTHRGNVYTGNWGVAAGISFYVTKNLGAAGDGGMILTNNDAVAEHSRSLRVHGMGRERYYYDHVGYTSRMAEIQAAILRVKLKKLDEWNERRTKFAALYDEILSDSGLALPKTLPGNTHTWQQYTIRTPHRDALQAMLKSRDVDSMVYYPVPLHFHKPYANLSPGPDSLPCTLQAAREVLSLPIQQHLSEEQIRFAAELVREFAHSSALVQ